MERRGDHCGDGIKSFPWKFKPRANKRTRFVIFRKEILPNRHFGAILHGEVNMMTALQKTLATFTMVAAMDLGIYEAHHAATLRTQVQTLQREQAARSEKIRQSQFGHGDAAASAGNISNPLADKNFQSVIRALAARSHLDGLPEPEAVITSGRGIQGQFVYFDAPAVSTITNSPSF
jgi:hypothetical protein